MRHRYHSFLVRRRSNDGQGRRASPQPWAALGGKIEEDEEDDDDR